MGHRKELIKFNLFREESFYQFIRSVIMGCNARINESAQSICSCNSAFFHHSLSQNYHHPTPRFITQSSKNNNSYMIIPMTGIWFITDEQSNFLLWQIPHNIQFLVSNTCSKMVADACRSCMNTVPLISANSFKTAGIMIQFTVTSPTFPGPLTNLEQNKRVCNNSERT